MTPRHALLLGASLIALATAADAQQRQPSREDLLDAVTRHIQICAEINEGAARLSCYDKLQTQVGDVRAPAPSPTPLANNSPPPQPPPSSGGQLGATPLAPPPLAVPGGGVATLGGPPAPGAPTPLAPPISDPDRAFNPRDATTAYQPPEGAQPRPQPRCAAPAPARCPTTDPRCPW